MKTTFRINKAIITKETSKWEQLREKTEQKNYSYKLLFRIGV